MYLGVGGSLPSVLSIVVGDVGSSYVAIGLMVLGVVVLERIANN